MPHPGHAPDTSATLLGRLSEIPANQNAWHEFVAIYGYHLLEWSKRLGLQDADAEDVTQLTLVRLAKVMRTFEYNPNLSFRAWLRTVAQHVWHDFVRSNKKHIYAGVSDHNQLFTQQAEQDFTQSIESAFDEELLKRSFDNVRLRVNPQTWEAFRLTAFEKIPSKEAATRLGINLATVYKAKSNVIKLLQDEMQYLEASLR